MNALLVLSLSVGLACADIGLTLRNYQVPQTSYGFPSYQYSTNDDNNSGYSGSGYNYNAPSAAQSGSHTGYQAAISLGADAGNNAANADKTQFYNTGDLNSINTISPSSYQYNDAQQAQGNYQNQYQNQYQYQSSSQYQASAVKKYQEFYNQWQQQPVQVFKHFYVHTAPEDPEPPKLRQPVVLPPPQKHYKIIFIKAPSQTVYQPQYIPVPQPNEEKTIVYVLVKKPEEQQEVQIPEIQQKTPSKPEVYFIKYNNKGDSQAVINNIVNEYGKGDSASYVNGASGQNQGASGSGQYAQGQYSTGSGYNQFAQGGQASTAGYGLQSTGSDSTGFSTANSVASLAATGAASSTSNYNFSNLNTIPTSQGVPHETYGPPKFKV